MSGTAPESQGAGLGASSELRRSVGKATERIHEIIDAAERVAIEIRSDAESEAEAYLAARRREADRLAEARTAALDELSQRLAATADSFRSEAERMLTELDSVISEARATAAHSLPASPPPAPAPPAPEREPEPERELRPLEAVTRVEPEIAPEPGTADVDTTAEALLRATQMAVTGKDRGEIVAALEADFPGVDSEAVADEILG